MPKSEDSLKALHLYPEFANTFILTHAIESAERNFANCCWTTHLCNWNENPEEELMRFCDESNSDLSEIDFISFYGTPGQIIIPEKFNIKEFEADSKYDIIDLPYYHPRFFFIPFDYTIFDAVYKDIKIDPNGIVTEKDINDIPDINNEVLKKKISERGLSDFISDTKKQSEFIEKKLLNLFKKQSLFPIRAYYYGAPITIFYLNLYPKYLPIRIPSELYSSEKNLFKTCLYIIYKKNSIVDRENLQIKIRETFVRAYLEAKIEPQLISNIYSRYKEVVPRGKFYTMKDVSDFAKAITLHCTNSDETLAREMGIEEDLIKNEKEKIELFLRKIKDITTPTYRNAERVRVSNLQLMNDLALGCKVYLLLYLFDSEFKTFDFWDAISDDIFFYSWSKDVFNGRYVFLYKATVSCLTWDFLIKITPMLNSYTMLSYSNLTKPTKRAQSNNPLSVLDKYHYQKNNIYENYKLCESKIIKQYNDANETTAAEKVIRYVEYSINTYVEESLEKKDVTYLKSAYKLFCEMIRAKEYKKTIISYFIRLFVPLKVYKYKLK